MRLTHFADFNVVREMMALKRRHGNRKVEDIEWTVPLHTGTFQHLCIEAPGDTDGVILAKLTPSGLVPYALCLTNQIDPEKLQEILRTESTVSQIVAIPYRIDEWMDLVKSFTVVDTVAYDAEPCCERPSPAPHAR